MPHSPPSPSRPAQARPAQARRTRGRPRSEDVQAIADNLLSTALEEFVTHGYGGASLARIVRKAGVSKTTLWSRYAGKEALFRAILQRQMEWVDGDAMLGTNGACPDLARGLAAYAEHVLATSLKREMRDINQLILTESYRFPELGAASIDRTRLGVAQVSAFIARCTAADSRPCPNPDVIAGVFIAALRGWHSTVTLPTADQSPRHRVAFIQQLVAMVEAARKAW